MALDDGAGLDFAALRAARRERVFAAMEEHAIDVLMLNRGGNTRYVTGEQLMRTVRAIKLPAEIECIRTAIAITEGALAAIRDDVQPGVTEQELKGRYHEEMCRFGINHPAMEGTFCATPRARANGDDPPPLRLLPDE